MVSITSMQARSLVSAALIAQGFSLSASEVCVTEIVEAEWRGRTSHGLSLVPELVEWSSARRHEPLVIDRGGGVAFVEGGDGPGPWVAHVAMDEAIDRATRHGVGWVGAANRCPLLVAGHQPRRAARAGFVAIVMCTAPSRVAPFGGTRPLFGTNPLAAAFPRDDGPPVVVDLSMAMLPASEVRRRGRAGELLPAGIAIDSDGRPTLEPVAAQSGAMVPFGGHKGSALALMVELLAGALTGTRVGVSQPGVRGMLFVALSPDLFGRGGAYAAAVDSMVADMAGAGPQVRVPGTAEPDLAEPRWVPATVVDALRALADPPAGG